MSEEIFNSKIEENAKKVYSVIAESKKISSWDIKMKLGLSSSMLYMTIGYLLSTQKINVYSRDLIYIIEDTGGKKAE